MILKMSNNALFAIALVLGFSACGVPEPQLSRIKNLADDSPIKVAIVDSDSSGNIATVLANAINPVISGSFEYCFGEVAACVPGSQNRHKLETRDGSTLNGNSSTSVIHKIPNPVDLRTAGRLNLFALSFDTKKSITTSVRFKSVLDSIPTPSIDRFNFEAAKLKAAATKLSGIDYDYKYGEQELSATNPGIRVKITNQDVLNLGSKLGVVIGGISLSDSSQYLTSNTAATIDQNGVLTVVGENFKPSTLYKVRLHFFERTSKDPKDALYLGASSRVYMFSTSGATKSTASLTGDPLDMVRARIVMRGLAEEYDWELDRYDTSKGYTNDPGYGWCHLFYNWVIKPYLKTRQNNTHTHYYPAYWDQFGAQISGAALVEVSQTEPILGDYFHVGTHVGMILAYDVAASQFITLEGNLNNRVQLMRRSPAELSWVGHLKSAMLK